MLLPEKGNSIFILGDEMNNDNFETSDFYLTVTLLGLGYTIINFNVIDPRRVVFIFEMKEGLSESVQDFWEDKIQLNPKLIFSCQKELKGRMSQVIR